MSWFFNHGGVFVCGFSEWASEAMILRFERNLYSRAYTRLQVLAVKKRHLLCPINVEVELRVHVPVSSTTALPLRRFTLQGAYGS